MNSRIHRGAAEIGGSRVEVEAAGQRILIDAGMPRGVLLSANPRGHNEEGWSGERYGVYHDLETLRAYLCAAGSVELDHYFRPTVLPREQQPWLAIVWRRDDSLDRHSPSRT